MINNPLFAPQNVRQQYRQGPQASLAYALMPTENFAQKRADSAMKLQYEAMLSGLADQAVAEKEKALRETQESLSIIDKQKLLQPDTLRLNKLYADRWRNETEQEVIKDFGGDIVRWKRERQPYHVARIDRELNNAPEYAQAQVNKTNYAQASEALAKGKLIVGNYDQDWADFVTGKSSKLNFRGAYDAPKEGFDYFDKNLHPTSPYGVNGKPIQVSQNDLAAHLLSQGMTPDQARDYMGKINYQGGRYWKLDSQKPWDAANDAWDKTVDKNNFGLHVKQFNEQARHNRAMENRADKDAKAKADATPALSAADLVLRGYQYAPTKVQTLDGKRWRVVEGFTGKASEAVHSLAGTKTSKDGEYVSEQKYIEGTESLNPKFFEHLFPSTVQEVYSLDGKKKIGSTTGSPIRFRDVDSQHVLYDPIAQKDGSHRAFVKAKAYTSLDGGPTGYHDVLVPLNENPASVAAVNETGLNGTKAESAQFNTYYERENARRAEEVKSRSRLREMIDALKMDK